MINSTLLIISLLLLLGCNPFGHVKVSGIVDPDKIAPTVDFITEAPGQMRGAEDFRVEFEAFDNLGGSGIKDIFLMYSPDGENIGFEKLKTFKVAGKHEIIFCPPNKNHPKPTFKIIASDNKNNKTEVFLGHLDDALLSLLRTPPLLPQVTSSEGANTNEDRATLLIDSCRAHACSNSAIFYEEPTSDIFVAIGATRPTVGDSTQWISCQEVLEDGFTLPPFTGDGDFPYEVWTKVEDVDLDGTTPITVISDTSSSIIINRDSTPPAFTLHTVAGAMNSHERFNFSFDLLDSNSGIKESKIYYSPSPSQIPLIGYDFKELGILSSGSLQGFNFCVPHKTHPNPTFKIESEDNIGNKLVREITGFTINKTSNSLLPQVRDVSLVSSSTDGKTKILIDQCRQTACQAGDFSYANPENEVFVSVSTTRPDSSSSTWISCNTVLSEGYSLTVGPQVGAGLISTHSLWVKSQELDLDGTTVVATVSTDSVPLSIPYNFLPPQLSDIDLGNIGENINLEIAGTSVLTGYSQGSFRVNPSCIHPSSIPNVQEYIDGVVRVHSNNRRVTGTGTSFLTAYEPYDYVEIKGSYVQIKSIESDTELTLNENLGNRPEIVGTDLKISKRMEPYGGVLITKGLTTVPLGSEGNWQPCDSINLSMTSGDLVNGVNRFQFWIKDIHGNSSTSHLSFDVNYTAPILKVEGGPTISNEIADITINACGGGTRITHVLFNQSGTRPDLASGDWQACSTAIGALKSMKLAPGNHVLKAFFKYNDNFISQNPVDVPVNYLPRISWVEDPLTIRPQTSYTLASCVGVDEVFINQGSAPAAGDSGWVSCSTDPGYLKFDLPVSGTQTVNVWYKTDGVVYSDYSEAIVHFVPPRAYIHGGTTVRTANPALTIDTCNNISKVFVKINDSTSSAPTSGDFSGPNGLNCTTALNGVVIPTLGYEGAHTIDVWYQFNDGYILNPWFTRLDVVYLSPDTTPPVIDGTIPGSSTIQLTLTNGDGDGAVPGIRETIENYNSRAHFTLNTCETRPNVLLAGTISISPQSRSVQGVGTQFSSNVNAGDYILISGMTYKVESVSSDTELTLILRHPAGVSGVTGYLTYPDDIISSIIWTQSSTPPLGNDPYWQTCTTAASGFKTRSVTDGDYTFYAWFKDASGNIATNSISKEIRVLTSPDTTPPDRPMVIVEGAPRLSSAPARLTIEACNDVDQVYIETSRYPNPHVQPDISSPIWQDCSEAVGSIIYNVSLAGSYTVSAWFKDRAGNINPEPREVSFIFEPAQGDLPNPIAYWTMDKIHMNKNRVVDAKGDSHLYRWDLASILEIPGKNGEGLNLSGTQSYLFTENTSTLKPEVAVTLSMWVELTNNDSGTKGLAGNGSYGLKIEDNKLTFFASGSTNDASVLTSSYSSGWHHLTGTSDGRFIKLYIDGQLVQTRDLGSPFNLTYSGSQLFVVGGFNDANNSNPSNSGLFTGGIDEVVVWASYFDDQMALDHYIDTVNKFKVGQHSNKPSAVSSAQFYGEFLGNALLTIPNCGEAKWIYVHHTTHPPLVDTPDWQLCNNQPGGIHYRNLAQGSHELKIWSKDEYNNISDNYLKIDTTITRPIYQSIGSTYYTLDNVHNDISQVGDIFSSQSALSVGASAGQLAIQKEGYLFNRAEGDFIERKFAFNSQPSDKVTISLWAQLTQGVNLRQVLAGTRRPGHGYSIEIDNVESKLKFIVETSTGSREASISVDQYTSGYHNIIGTYDGRFISLYIDAEEVDQVEYPDLRNVKYDSLGAFTIGAGATNNLGPVAGTHFNGIIDEVIVWNDALTQNTIEEFFFGQDTVPPLAVPVTPKNNEYTILVPIARLNVGDCSDIASVYVSLDEQAPTAGIANWQTCSESGNLIKSPLLEIGTNTLKVWFKDAAGNVSNTSTDLAMTYVYDEFLIPNPISYWPLDNVNVDGAQAFDVISDHHGIIIGAVTTPGQVEEGRLLSGINQFIEVKNNEVFRPEDELTFSLWFKQESRQNSEQVIFGNYNNGGYQLSVTDQSLDFKINVNENVYTLSTGLQGAALGEWHHVTGIYNQGLMRLFLNNQEVHLNVSEVDKKLFYSVENSLLIGGASALTSGADSKFFAGSVDDVAYWDFALSDTSVEAIYERGVEGDQLYYKITRPEIPINLSITYYNSLVSRANLTMNSCTGLDYVIVTKDEFPPDKNDNDWQVCNTLTGGILSKELLTTDSFGKIWTKDRYGNISRNFEYVPISTLYDFKIKRPIVHWTFDNDHYRPVTRTAFDRLSQINLSSETLYNTSTVASCNITLAHDPDRSVLRTNQPGVLRQSFGFAHDGSVIRRPAILRANHPENIKTKPTKNLSVAAWVYINRNQVHEDKHIVSNLVNGKGWALRLESANIDDRGLRFTVYTNGRALPLEPYLETKNISTGWHLVVGTFDGVKASLFLDGIFVKSFSLPAPAEITYEDGVNTFVGSKASTGVLPTNWVTSTRTSGCNSGYNNYPANSFYQQPIDEVIVWDKTLDGLEVSSLYHNGADILYKDDIIPPPLPTLSLENTRPNMFSNKAYFTVNDCNDGLAVENQISGVLVNEGTMPDKQDARWEICRERRGSFGLENLDYGGHTITTWFKDRAGNVTPVSGDVVVDYIEGLFPSSNAFWPLDSSHTVDNKSRDVVDDKVHDLTFSNFKTSLNPSADHDPDGVVNEGVHLAAQSPKIGSYLTTPSTILLTPVNYFSVGGWFKLEDIENQSGEKVLIDQHSLLSATNRNGYKFSIINRNLVLRVELDIAKTQVFTHSISTITDGWHHVLATFTGWEIIFYVNSIEVARSPRLEERDFIRYDNMTPFRVGAESEHLQNPSNFFDGSVDEIGLWGFDLNTAEVQSVFNAGLTGQHVHGILGAPNNVDNAFIYHYDNFGSRARMTMLECENTPYLYVKEQGGTTPSSDDGEWRSCSTVPGSIISAKLPVGTQYVNVWSKNSDGIISTIPGRKEILPIIHAYDLPLPISYLSFNSEHVNDNREFDSLLQENTQVKVNSFTRVDNVDGGALKFNANNSSLKTLNNAIYDLRAGLTLALWIDLPAGPIANQTIIQRNSATNSSNVHEDTAIIVENNEIKFNVNIPNFSSVWSRSTQVITASYSLDLIPRGKTFIAASFDGFDAKLYINSVLAKTTNASDRNYSSSSHQIIDMFEVSGFEFGPNLTNEIDEFMVFNYDLSEKDIVNWYRRYKDTISPGDTTAPSNGRQLTLFDPSGTGVNSNTTTHDNPYFTINDCSDVNAVYVSLSSTPPSYEDDGWQVCQTLEAYLRSPQLAAGSNTLYFYYRDSHGNISLADTVTIDYNIPARPLPVAYWNMDDKSRIGMRIFEPMNRLDAYTFGILPSDFITPVGGVGKAISLDGSRKYLEVEHSSIIKPTEELSISIWVDVPYTRPTKTILTNRGSSFEGYELRWNCSLNPLSLVPTNCSESAPRGSFEFLEFIIHTDRGTVYIDYPSSKMVHHTGLEKMLLTATFDGRLIRLYKNGVMLREKDLKVEHTIVYDNDKKSSLIIGARGGDYQRPVGGYYDGTIDELSIFNEALHPVHVADIYENFIQTGTQLVDDTSVPVFPLGFHAEIYEPYKNSFGTRLKVSLNTCLGVDQVLVKPAGPAPSNNDENWQHCNTLKGGILSAPFTISSYADPVVWVKTFEGVVSATSFAIQAPPCQEHVIDGNPPQCTGGYDSRYRISVYKSDIPRPNIHWSFDSSYSGHTNPLVLLDSLNGSHGEISLSQGSVVREVGPFEISPNSRTLTGDLTALEVGDIIRIKNESVQIETLDPLFALLKFPHAEGVTAAENLKGYILRDNLGNRSVIEDGRVFNGFSDGIEVHATADTNPMYKMSISAWAYLKQGENQHRHIIGNLQDVSSEGGKGAGLRIFNGELQFYLNWDGNLHVVGVDTNIYRSGLRHIGGTYDGRDLTLYLDGVKVNTYMIQLFNGATNHSIIHDDYTPWVIGAEPSDAGAMRANSFFDGVIDEVMLWHTDLTEEQMYYVFESGSTYLPIIDTIPPKDPMPGIALSDGLTNSDMPWAHFTMPSCQDADGVEINAIYIGRASDPAPTEDQSGWQFCSTDEAYIVSQLLQEGSNNLVVYYRGEQGAVSGVIANFDYTYIPPELIHPHAYYNFNTTTNISPWVYKDIAGTKNIRATYLPNISSPVNGGGKVGSGILINAPGSTLAYTNSISRSYGGEEYQLEKNFAVAFWYKNIGSVSGGLTTLLNQGQYRIARTSGDTISVNIGSVEFTSRQRMRPYQWIHIGVVRENNRLEIYINGRKESSYIVPDSNLNTNTPHLTFGGVAGYYDEVVLYDKSLTASQMAYIYYQGERSEDIRTYPEYKVATPIPDYYWDFDSENVASNTLNAVKGDLPLVMKGDVASGQVDSDARFGESFFFERHEETVTSGELNPVGPLQYLESSNPVDLGIEDDFTIALWVKQPQVRGFNGTGLQSGHNDNTAVIDLWANTSRSQTLSLTYTRGISATTEPEYTFILNTKGGSVSLETIGEGFTNGWVHLVVRKSGRYVQFFVNGMESVHTQLSSNLDSRKVTPSIQGRLRIGNSGRYGRYLGHGTVSLNSGSKIVTGIGTEFSKYFYIHEQGTLNISAGATTFTVPLSAYELKIDDFIKINDQIIKVTNVVTNMTSRTVTLEIPVTANYSGNIILPSKNPLVVNGQSFIVESVLSDTQLQLKDPSTVTRSDSEYYYNINNSNFSSDEYGLNGFVDELAVWNKALKIHQIRDLYTRNRAIDLIPIANLLGQIGDEEGVIFTDKARFTINDCNGNDYIYVGVITPMTPSTPDVSDPNWISCVAGMEIETDVIYTDDENTIRVWFKKDDVVASYHSDLVIEHRTPSAIPPVIPTITLTNSNPTSDSFARFTLSSCAGINGVYVAEDGYEPSLTSSKWQLCTTVGSRIISEPLETGSNNLKLWFRNTAGLTSQSGVYLVNKTANTIADPEFYFTMDQEHFGSRGYYGIDIAKETLGKGFGFNSSSLLVDEAVNDAIEFTSNSRFDFLSSPITLTDELSVFAWINVTQMTAGSDGLIVGRWTSDKSENVFALRVDSNGRICLDVRNNNALLWNSLNYLRSCSSSKIKFANWEHVGVVRDGSSIKFYINDNEAGVSIIGTENFHSSNAPLRIGAEMFMQDSVLTKKSQFIGKMDEVSIWNRVLSNDERSALFAKGLKGEGLMPRTTPSAPTDLDKYWNFDSTLEASLGGYEFVPQGEILFDTTNALVDSHVVFSALNPRLSLSLNSGYQLGDEFTVSLWIRPANSTASTIISKHDVEFPVTDPVTYIETFAIKMNISRVPTASLRTVDGVYSIVSPFSLNLNEWYQLSITKSADTLSFFINGEILGQVPITGSFLDDSSLGSLLSLGGLSPVAANQFLGAYDELIIYKSTLSAAQVKELYEKGLDGEEANPPH